jgi:hypothetical protein
MPAKLPLSTKEVTMSKFLPHKLLLAVAIAALLATLLGIQPAFAARTCTIRYYISPVVGTGTADDPVRPLVIDLPSYPHHTFATDWEIVYNPDAHPYAMVGVASPNHKPLLNNEQLGILPDIPFDTDAHDEMSPADQALISRVIYQFGMDSEAVLDEADTYGDILYQMAAYVNGFVVWPGIPTPDSCPVKQPALGQQPLKKRAK